MHRAYAFRRFVLSLAIVGLTWPATVAVRAAPPAATADPATLDYDNPPAGIFLEDWYVAEMAGVPCGYMHGVTRRVDDVIESDLTMKFSIRRDKIEITVSVEQQYREKLDGTPLDIVQTMVMANQPIKTTAVLKDGKVRVTTEQFGSKQRKTYPLDADVKFPWALAREQRRRGFAPGTKFTVKSYDPSASPEKPLSITTDIIGPEEVDLPSGRRTATRVRTTTEIDSPMLKAVGNGLGKIEGDGWLDEAGFPLVTEMNLGFVKVRLLKSDRESALKDVRGPELFFSTFVKAKGRVEAKAREITYRVRVREGELPDFPTTAMQTFKRTGPREGLLTIKRLDWKAIRAATSQPAPESMTEEFLQPSTFIDSKNARIRRLAKEGAGDAKSPGEIANALRIFVTDYIQDKDLTVAFATATEVAKSRKGDCTEHGVLLAALARACGIPARVVGGLVMLPGSPADGASFGYHMWTQVWIAGRWVDIDAALRQTDVDATHMALALMSLHSEGLLESMMAIIPMMGRLEIEALPPP